MLRFELRRRYFYGLFGLILMGVSAWANARSAAIATVRDVELTFVGEKLIALAWHRSQTWRTFVVGDHGELHYACELPGRSWLSWNRKHLISQTFVGTPQLTVRDPYTCQVIAQVPLALAARDADVHVAANRLAAATRTADGIRLALYALDGGLIADLGLIANAELGFSADGSVLFNLDHGGGTALAWDAHTGARRRMPWLDTVDVLVTEDGKRAFLTAPGRVESFAWPAVDEPLVEPIPTWDQEVLRGVSRFGNSLLLQQPGVRDPKMPSVRLFEPATGRSRPLASGHIDAVALDGAGTQVGIAVRDPVHALVRISKLRAHSLFTP
jgi:energy-converting hydrogenase Eha subunit E